MVEALPAHPTSLIRLLQLSSPSLPVGAYSYSQGLEWAVETGWVKDIDSFRQWVVEQLHGTIAQQDLPLLQRMIIAAIDGNATNLMQWDAMALSMRETSELRSEERQRGRAMAALMQHLDIGGYGSETQLAMMAVYCAHENISIESSLSGYAYSWLDSQVTAGIKLVPFGQGAGQRILYDLTDEIIVAMNTALNTEDENIGYTSPAIAMASSQHETQYSRLFRS